MTLALATFSFGGTAFGQTPAPVAPQARTSVTPEEAATRRSAAQEKLLADWPNLAKYRAANNALPAPGAKEDRVVFMGDSITEFWGRPARDAAPGTPNSFFPDEPYIDRGISGQTSPQMLLRFQQDVIALKPAVVLILAGTNDIAENTGKMEPVDTQNNIRSMVELARANGIAPVLCSITPSKSFWWHTDLKPAKDIVAMNRWIAQYAAEQHLPYVDYYTPLAAPDGGMNPDYSGDGVHPNPKGYAVMAPLAEAGIAKALHSRH